MDRHHFAEDSGRRLKRKEDEILWEFDFMSTIMCEEIGACCRQMGLINSSGPDYRL